MSFSVGATPVYLLGSDAAPVTVDTDGTFTQLPGANNQPRSVIVEGNLGGGTVIVSAANALRPSDVVAITAPVGGPLTFTSAQMVEMPAFPNNVMLVNAQLTGSTGASVRVYIV